MAVKTFGTVFAYGDTADHATATTWTPVAKVKSIKPMKITAKDIDITVLDSPDEFEEIMAGLGSGGDIELTVRYDKTQTGAIYALYRTTKAFRHVYPDNSGWKYNGFVQEIGDNEVSNGEIVWTTLKIKITGKPVQVSSFGS